MISQPFISVIIPVYNGERFLAEAIESVLTQNYSPLEIIVVDDGSTDETRVVACRYMPAVHYIYQPNSGTSVARNTGVQQAKGELLAFLDADDVWMPQKLIRQVQALQAETDIGAVFGYVQQFHSAELTQAERDAIICPTAPMDGYLPSAMLIKRSAFDHVGPFDANLVFGEFVSWYARLKDSDVKTCLLATVVARRRLHQTNKGRQHQSYNAEMLMSLKALLDRRRALAAGKEQTTTGLERC
ncbi:MAG: glycosyltransferase family A protein [Cyanobacteria bacterium P01_D01_bin.105]